MQFTDIHYQEISAYPGEYTPVQFKLESLASELSKPHEGASKPDYNICETSEYYKIEIAVPGLKREDFFVCITEDGHLSVSALHNELRGKQTEKYSKHNFNYECFHRNLVLPENIDTDFVKAEYRTGILFFWFLKTKRNYEKRASVIIVY
jgi:HSP20 family protein